MCVAFYHSCSFTCVLVTSLNKIWDNTVLLVVWLGYSFKHGKFVSSSMCKYEARTVRCVFGIVLLCMNESKSAYNRATIRRALTMVVRQRRLFTVNVLEMHFMVLYATNFLSRLLLLFTFRFFLCATWMRRSDIWLDICLCYMEKVIKPCSIYYGISNLGTN